MLNPRRARFAVAAVAGGVVLAALVGEAVLRLAWPQRSAVTIGMFRDDPHAGYSLQPDYRNFVRVPEYTTSICIDPDGYRVPEGADSPGDAGLQVLAIGDSFTFGVGVEAEDAWPHVLGSLLDPGGTGRVAVRNGGVGGYGPLRSARLLEGRQGAWGPELLVHGIYVGNDLEDCQPATFRETPQIRDGRMVANVTNPLTRARFWLRVHSHFYAFLRQSFYGVYQRTRLPSASRYLDPMGLAEWPERITGESWPAAQAALREIAAWAAEHDVRYLVVLIPSKYQVSDASWAAYRERWKLPADAFDRTHAQREITRFLDAEGIAGFDLLPQLLTDPDRDALYFPVDAHWTPAGHRRAAAVIRAELVRRGWVAGRETGRAPVASAAVTPTG